MRIKAGFIIGIFLAVAFQNVSFAAPAKKNRVSYRQIYSTSRIELLVGQKIEAVGFLQYSRFFGKQGGSWLLFRDGSALSFTMDIKDLLKYDNRKVSVVGIVHECGKTEQCTGIFLTPESISLNGKEEILTLKLAIRSDLLKIEDMTDKRIDFRHLRLRDNRATADIFVSKNMQGWSDTSTHYEYKLIKDPDWSVINRKLLKK